MKKVTFNYQEVMAEYCQVNNKSKMMVESLYSLDTIIDRLEVYLSGKLQIPECKIDIIRPTHKVIKKCFYPDGSSSEHFEGYFDCHVEAIKFSLNGNKRLVEIGRENALLVISEVLPI